MFVLLFAVLLFCARCKYRNTNFQMSDKDNSNVEVRETDYPRKHQPLRPAGSEEAGAAEERSRPATETEERGTIKDERADDDEHKHDGAQPDGNANLPAQVEALQAMVQSLTVTVRSQDTEMKRMKSERTSEARPRSIIEPLVQVGDYSPVASRTRSRRLKQSRPSTLGKERHQPGKSAMLDAAEQLRGETDAGRQEELLRQSVHLNKETVPCPPDS